MGELVKYEPQTVIRTYGGEFHFTDKSLKVVKMAMEASRVIDVGGELINVRDVQKVYTDRYGVSSLSREQRAWLERRKKEFQQNLGRKPSDASIQKMIARASEI